MPKKGYQPISLDLIGWEEFTKELRGKTVRCTYSQIFNSDSSLILCNEFPNVHPEIWDCIENGDVFDENENYVEICQYFIIDENTAERLKEHTDHIIFYCDSLDLYILGVTHWGTSWDYVGAEFVY